MNQKILKKTKNKERGHLNKLSDIEFEKQFIACKINPLSFSHEAHLCLAWININLYESQQAEINIQKQLQNFIEFVGEKQKYNDLIEKYK